MGKIQLIAGIKSKNLREKIANDLCDDCLYKAIHEIALNTAKGNIKLNSKLKKKLKHSRKLILRLASKNKAKKTRKRLVKQSGGFLNLILPALLSAIGAYGAFGKD